MIDTFIEYTTNPLQTDEAMIMEEKYPSEPILIYFRDFYISKGDILTFLTTLENEWWAADWGYEQTERDGKIYLQLHTGGWSGNESIITALEGNKTFWKFLKKEETGGHYWFEIEVK